MKQEIFLFNLPLVKDKIAVRGQYPWEEKADLWFYKSEIMSDEVEVDTRQIYLIPADGNDGMQNTEVNFNNLC